MFIFCFKYGMADVIGALPTSYSSGTPCGCHENEWGLCLALQKNATHPDCFLRLTLSSLHAIIQRTIGPTVNYCRCKSMDNVVPGALRHLREADIMSMAGLELAALGQEYYRIGAVHSTMRQEVQLTGIVEVPDQAFEKTVSPTNAVGKVQGTGHVEPEPGRYLVKVKIQGTSAWSATCSCNVPSDSLSICPHAAALLYQWLAHPLSFISPASDSNFPEMPSSQQRAEPLDGVHESEVLPESTIERY